MDEGLKKILLVTFSDNADHQDTLYGMYEQLIDIYNVYLLTINTPKVSVKKSDKTWFVDCPKRPGITKKTFDLKLLFSIIKRIRKQKFDVIYFESLHIWNLPIIMMSGKARTYHVIHEVIPHEGDKQVKMVDLMNRMLVKITDIIVLRNKLYVSEMTKRYGIAANRVKYVELWRRYPGFTEPKYGKKVLFFGRINPYKGADNLLEIAKMCPDIQFEVIGRVDIQVQDIIDNLNQLSNVKMNTDYVTDAQMKRAFEDADVVIVPYNSASQSGIIIDAYKYSRPVVGFSVGAIPEQIKDGKTGYLIEYKNNALFAQKIRELLNLSNDEFLQVCKYSYEYGLKKYGVSNAVARFKKLMEE